MGIFRFRLFECETETDLKYRQRRHYWEPPFPFEDWASYRKAMLSPHLNNAFLDNRRKAKKRR